MKIVSLPGEDKKPKKNKMSEMIEVTESIRKLNLLTTCPTTGLIKLQPSIHGVLNPRREKGKEVMKEGERGFGSESKSPQCNLKYSTTLFNKKFKIG